MLTAVGSLTLLGTILGVLLGVAAKYLKVEGNALAAEVEAMLPGSQCGQCGFPGCGPAAQALAEGKADVTLCPPGGRALAAELALKLSVTVDLSAMEEKEPEVAFVNEALCIGCTRCFQQCPTDAFVGGPKQIHGVISDICIGCRKCIDICPTECITMQPLQVTVQTWFWPKPETTPHAKTPGQIKKKAA